MALDGVLAALADPHRRRAVELLSTGPMRAGEIAKALDLPAPAVSRHLRVLREQGLVEPSHPDFDARVRVYTLKAGAMAELRDWVARTENLWARQLLAFKAHLEGGTP